MKTKKLIYLFLPLILLIGSYEAVAGLDYCWKTTEGRGVGTIPTKCSADQDTQGKAPFFTCYKKCPKGYDSTALGGCMQKCPAKTKRDAFGNCVDNGKKKRYKNVEYTVASHGLVCLNDDCFKKICKKDSSANGGKKLGCEKFGAAIVAKCKKGYKRAALHCIPDLDCKGYAGKGVDAFGKTFCETKRLAPRSPQPADCGSGKENDAGLCYPKCGSGSDGVGPVCWDKCPKVRGKQWVECGAGCAADSVACGLNTSDMVISVLDSAISIATIGSGSIVKGVRKAGEKGASAGIRAAVKAGGKKFGTTLAKSYTDLAKGGAKTALSAVGIAQDANRIKSGSLGIKAFIGGVQEVVGKDISQEEMDFQIAQLALGTAALVDPSGVLGVVAAYTKPLCSVMVKGSKETHPNEQAGFVDTIVQDPSVLITTLENQIKISTARIAELKKDKKANASEIKKETKLLKERKAILANLKKGNSLNKLKNVKKEDLTTTAKPTTTTKPVVSANGKVNWKKVSGKAVDISSSDGKNAVWATNSKDHILHLVNNKWVKKSGAAKRISVSYWGNPWVVNGSGQVWRWVSGKWQLVKGLQATDIGLSKAIWAISKTKVGGGYTIHQYDDKSKKWLKRPGGAVRIAVSQSGNPWVVNSAGSVFRWLNGKWKGVPGVKAQDIGIGADNSVWVTTKKGEIYFTKDLKKWVKSTGAAVAIDVGFGGAPWVVNKGSDIFTSK